MRLQIEIDEARLKELWHKAMHAGFMRDEPRKAWTLKEMRVAARWYLEKSRMIGDRQMAARRKLLGILPRASLERLSGLERPWHSSKPDLLDYAIKRWDGDEVREEIELIFTRANA